MSKTKQKNNRNVKSSGETLVDSSNERNFITVQELEQLIKACSKTRCPERNKAIILTMFWHGLRVSELCQLKTSSLDLKAGRLYVKRVKGSLSTTHPIRTEVLRSLKRYLKKRNSDMPSLFLNERSEPFERQGINYLLKSLSKKADLTFSVNPHKLRHGCGYALADMGHDTRLIQDYLGHKNIQNTVGYTRTSAKRFMDIWNK